MAEVDNIAAVRPVPDPLAVIRALERSLAPIAEWQVFPGGYDLYDPWWCRWRGRAQEALRQAREVLNGAR